MRLGMLKVFTLHHHDMRYILSRRLCRIAVELLLREGLKLYKAVLS